MTNQDSSTNPLDKNSLASMSVGVLVLFLVLIAGIYFWVAKKNKGGVVFPAGINYMGPSNLTPIPTVDLTQLGKSGKWLQTSGKIYKYSFIYPAELQVTAFINDQSDKLAWVTGIGSPQQSIAFTVESVASLDPKYEGDLEGFAGNYWRKFNGLGGAKSVEPFTNSKGLKGFKAVYADKTGKTINTNFFFAIPDQSDKVLQVINGIIPENIFMQIVNSIEFK